MGHARAQEPEWLDRRDASHVLGTRRHHEGYPGYTPGYSRGDTLGDTP